MTDKNEMDATDKLLRDLSLKDSGWHRVEGPAGSAFIPTAATDVFSWEQRAFLQAQCAERDTVIPEPKPMETGILRGRIRGD